MSDTGATTAERVFDLLSPVVESVGVELIDVEWAGGTLRVVVDQADGIATEKLVEVNRLVSPILDQHDPIHDRYVLEVTSPGVERPLRRVEHFERAVGEDVIVKLQPGADPRRIRGRLSAVDGGGITVEAVEFDGVELSAPSTIEVDLSEIDKARTVYDWSADFARANSNKKSKKTASSKGGAEQLTTKLNRNEDTP